MRLVRVDVGVDVEYPGRAATRSLPVPGAAVRETSVPGIFCATAVHRRR